MKDIIVATGNAGKRKEIGEILHDLPVVLTSLADHWNPIPEIPEEGATFVENALQKARWVFDRKGVWVLADDSGLEVDALNGLPGVKSARYAGEHAKTADNNQKLLAALASVSSGQRIARFKCVMVLVTANDSHFTAEGVCEGRIIDTPRGHEGFGYDPLFMPNGFSATFAELSATEKNRISHRGIALGKIRKHLNELL